MSSRNRKSFQVRSLAYVTPLLFLVLLVSTGCRVGTPSSAKVTVDDDDDATPRGQPDVTISAVASSVTEGTAVQFTVTIPTTGSAALTADTVDDTTDEPNSSVTATVNSGPGYTVGSPSSASVTVNDNDGQVIPDVPLPAVTISRAGASSVTEGTAVQFTVTATPAPQAILVVNVEWSSDPDSYLDGLQPTNLTIPMTGTATLTADTVDDTTDESNGTVTATVVNSGTGYTVGSPHSASVTVNDNDDAVVTPPLSGDPVATLSASPNPLSEEPLAKLPR